MSSNRIQGQKDNFEKKKLTTYNINSEIYVYNCTFKT